MKQFGRSLPKDQDALIDLARQQNWNVSKTANGHWRLVSPRGQIVIASGTTSDANSVLDLRARMKRYGLKPGKVRLAKPAPPEPKLVVDRSAKPEEKAVTEKVSVPPLPVESAVVATAKKERQITPNVRGGNLLRALVEAMRKHDQPDGVTPQDIYPTVKELLKVDVQHHTVGQGMMYYTKKDKTFTKVSYGRYRLTALLAPEPAKNASTINEDDDEKVLIEFLVGLDKVANVVKKHIELQKVLKQLQKLGTNK